MISGRFGEIGELFFQIDLIAADGEEFQVDALLDTGFTSGWLAINFQDLEAFAWPVIELGRAMDTARGEQFFDIYAGTVIFDGQEFTIPVHVGDELPETLMGLQWLQTMRLEVDFPSQLLTLG
ncbi:aspartyl protease [Kamptonema animale CS-326]|jgi:predicted aspartyl protease|uniref:aspartyl protease n=1 Tax=Kamptonema animale TaxID=92934 RepID=UPI00232D1A6E|nr:aspartyl protease [Kamptonema animale]MDB9514080.1 aspartyl protease [Kamptonema animale CS-326]